MKKPFSSGKTIWILLFLTVLLFEPVSAQFLSVKGKVIINSSNNQEVILNAINFGNWMVMEGYMMNSVSQAPDQHTWKNKLTSLMGSANTKTFYDAWLSNHVSQADIDQIRSWGFNSVRVPLHNEYFVNSGSPDVWNDQGFAILDNLISWCKTAGLYVIIDLHAAPGGQSNSAISDYDSVKPSLWESETNKAKTVALWKKISERYMSEPWVAGYDLINEPAWDLPGGVALRDLYGRITDAIRANGDNHMLFIEGNWYSNDYTGLTPAWDANMVYVFHKYWSNNSTQDIKWITDFRDAQNRPIWCGEHGENSNDHFTKIVETFKENNIGFSWWPMKKFSSINDFADAKFPAGYNDLLNYFGGTNPGLSPATAFNTVMQLAENVKLSNCTLQTEVIRSIFKQPGNRDTEAFAVNAIPGKLYTVHFDQGMNGYAYSDQAWEDVRLTTGNYTAWNNGWVYRNTGVDIEATSDPLSNGYTVGWYSSGEWMKYTVQIQQTGTYTVDFRIANGSGTQGKIQIHNAEGTEILATATVPVTGSWTTWQTVSVTGSFGTSGTQQIRIANVSGEFNVNSVNFTYMNPTVPPVVPVVKTSSIIYLKGNNDKYVTFEGNDNLVTSTRTTLGVNEKYTVLDLGGGLSALQAANGKYVTLNPTDNKLYCNSNTIGDYQKFTLTDLCGVYSIQGFNNLFVSSENGATSGMTCNRTVPQAWEYFKWGITGSIEVLGVELFGSEKLAFKVFPNPAQNSITVRSLQYDNLTITVYDIYGRLILKTSLDNNQNNLDVNEIPTGIYLMNISSPEASSTIKFVKN